MKYFILGGTGFIGSFLIRHLLEEGHNVQALVRPQSELDISHSRLSPVEGNAMKDGAWQDKVKDADVVINLVGKNIFTRWTDEAKEKILSTRIESTKQTVAAMAEEGGQVLVCANAVGYYGDRGDETLVEGSTAGEGFLAEVCVAWQKQAMEAEKKGHRVVVTRFAPVLGKGGGMLKQMVPPFKLGVGGPIGSGTQWFPWVHMTDLVRAVVFVVEHESIKGPVNVCGPEQVTNEQFSSKLAEVLNRPSFFRVPTFAVNLGFGEASAAVLASLRTIPGKLQEAGFTFSFPTVKKALEDLLT